MSKAEPDLEGELYDLLADALFREECAAKAAARLEFDLVQRYEEEREPPTKNASKAVEGEAEGLEEDKEPEREVADAASREFSSGEFQAFFSQLNTLRVVREMIGILGLEELEEEITQTMISDMFRTRPAQARGKEGQEAFIGTDMDFLFHKLQKMAERKQRNNLR